mmetsp:Transcript_39988/g.100738  ORF Transcript_39988/g.100738 Transcript_39988/m.100738 type:complete len:262 (-) Transcript_39988:148-933(-)|eukprot:CAMPEP_0177643530 /NCGR_PEP_ID=MMETSP0447-20121125/8201_1 /TAXON_ID=0 /ORGANISM="Stygamoeba regulata, Strain BSH-02190019" /LENGTH=261 /DNA_ID=CAMNT_0019145825 /DNA_START=42 /DNA_END=827 /DNA_ORIENTATION=-
MTMQSPAAGVLPFCFVDGPGPSTKEAYFLMGSQSNSLHGKSTAVLNCFWGYSDADDRDDVHTAAREGGEESLYCFGDVPELEQVLRHTEEHSKGMSAQLFRGCFLLNLGHLSQLQMDCMVRTFLHRRWSPELSSRLTHCEKEMFEVRWVRATDLYRHYGALSRGLNSELDAETTRDWKLRGAFHMQLVSMNWRKGALHEICCEGRSSLPSVWQRSATGKIYLSGESPSDRELMARPAKTSRWRKKATTKHHHFAAIHAQLF